METKHLKDEIRYEFFIKYGEIVAIRNEYVLDERLTKLNARKINAVKKTKKRRPIYVKYNGKKPQYYLSIDIEHGGLEVFKHKRRPEHLGEHNYSCNIVQDPSPNDHYIFLE